MHLPPRPLRLVIALFVCVGLSQPLAHAGGARVFRQTSAKDFEEGEAAGTQVLPTGELVPGLRTSRMPVDASFVWCSALSPDGATAYFATGDPARVYAVPTRAGADKEPPRKVLDLEGPWVTALAVRPDGSLLAATTPGAKVFVIDPQKGSARELSHLTVDYIWALTYDAKTQTIYAGTGGGGKIVAIDKTGKAHVHWDSGDKHIVSLYDLGGGALLAGTSDQGILYKVEANGRALALHDFDADEVRAIVRVGSSTYLAVNDFDASSESGRTGTPQESAAPKGTKVVTGGTSPASPGLLPRPGQVKAKAAIEKLDDDGHIEQIFAISDGYFTQLLADGNDVYAAAGVDGKVYRITADRAVALAVDVPERQALTLVRASGGFLLGTGDGGAIFRARPAAGAEATYLSKVLDGEQPSRWGHLRVTGTAGTVVETRSGNTAKPGKFWTDWQKLDALAWVGDEGDGRIVSPTARYLQYRLSLPRADSVVRDVTAYGLPQNQRPRVTDVTLATDSSSSTSAPRTHSAVLKLRFKVDNADNDDLLFKLSYRQESEPVWRPLGASETIVKPEYDWNTDSVPDGRYVVRVWVSDARAVAQDRALDSTFVSPPFLVDNTRPDVTGLSWAAGAVTGRAHDDASPITQIEFSVNGGEWRPASPSDGILDDKTESFSVKLPPLPAGTHVITVRASDAADNIGSGKLVFTTK